MKTEEIIAEATGALFRRVLAIGAAAGFVLGVFATLGSRAVLS